MKKRFLNILIFQTYPKKYIREIQVIIFNLEYSLYGFEDSSDPNDFDLLIINQSITR